MRENIYWWVLPWLLFLTIGVVYDMAAFTFLSIVFPVIHIINSSK